MSAIGSDGSGEDVLVLGCHGHAHVGSPTIAVSLTQYIQLTSAGVKAAALHPTVTHLVVLGVEGESHVIETSLINLNNYVVVGPCITPVAVTNHLECQLIACELAAILGQCEGAIGLLNHVIVSIAGIPLGAKYRCGSTCYGIGVNGDWNHNTLNLELEDGGVESKYILATTTGELVGLVTTLGG